MICVADRLIGFFLAGFVVDAIEMPIVSFIIIIITIFIIMIIIITMVVFISL